MPFTRVPMCLLIIIARILLFTTLVINNYEIITIVHLYHSISLVLLIIKLLKTISTDSCIMKEKKRKIGILLPVYSISISTILSILILIPVSNIKINLP